MPLLLRGIRRLCLPLPATGAEMRRQRFGFGLLVWRLPQ